jgi:hypothetical protein
MPCSVSLEAIYCEAMTTFTPVTGIAHAVAVPGTRLAAP